MKHRLFCLFLSLALWALPVGAQAAVVTPELFRLQVVAASDSAEDQAAKLAVRNAVVALAQEMFADVESAAEAMALAKRELIRFRTEAIGAAQGYPIRVEIGEFDFPDRIYGTALVPAGAYGALRITLGAGEGHNWWCVLYPTLCGIDESAVNPDGTITFYSETLEFLKRLFGGDEA